MLLEYLGISRSDQAARNPYLPRDTGSFVCENLTEGLLFAVELASPLLR